MRGLRGAAAAGGRRGVAPRIRPARHRKGRCAAALLESSASAENTNTQLRVCTGGAHWQSTRGWGFNQRAGAAGRAAGAGAAGPGPRDGAIMVVGEAGSLALLAAKRGWGAPPMALCHVLLHLTAT